MSAGGTGGVGGRREKTTALADECDSRCGACAATLTDEELEGGTGGTGSLSAHTGGPISSHSRASLCTRFAICLAQKSTPRRSRNPSRRRVLGSAAPYGTPRIGAVVDQLALPNRVAPRVITRARPMRRLLPRSGPASFDKPSRERSSNRTRAFERLEVVGRPVPAAYGTCSRLGIVKFVGW
jgi:hypothetical protein